VEKHLKSFFFSPKYRGKVLAGEVAEAAEEIIRETCKELDIEVIDMAINVNRTFVHKIIERVLYTYDKPIIIM